MKDKALWRGPLLGLIGSTMIVLGFIVFMRPVGLHADETKELQRKEKALWQAYEVLLSTYVLVLRFEGPSGTFEHNAANVTKKKDYMPLLKQQTDALKSVVLEDFTSTTESALAFWMNVYNFYTLEQVITRYPVKSMKHIGWKAAICFVQKKAYSLDDVEHQKIRPIGDGRIHFGINCASVSCPSLSPVVFTKENVDKQLTLLTQHALRNPMHLRFDKQGKHLLGSALFNWFKTDFEKKPFKNVLAFVRFYVPETAKKAKKVKATLPYDWNLNTEKNIMAYYKDLERKDAITVKRISNLD